MEIKQKLKRFWKRCVCLPKVLNISFTTFLFIILCLLFIFDDISLPHIEFSEQLIEIKNKIIKYPSINYIFILVLIWAFWGVVKRKQFNIYLFCICITFSILLYKVLPQTIWSCGCLKIEKNTQASPKAILFVFFFFLTLYELLMMIIMIYRYIKRSKFGAERKKKKGYNRGFCIRTKEEDIIDLGWDNYAKALLLRINDTNLDYGESFAIGIVGQWGSGKTSFLNTFEKTMGEDFIVIKFIPWYSQAPTSLVRDFFDCVSSELGSKNINIDFSKYIELLQVLDSTRILEVVNKIIPHTDNSIEKIRKDIEDQLSLIRRKVVIIIDDTDRLRSDELMEMLKIIRLTANFNNVVFIVTYDKDYILEKIKETKITNGSEYLKKIFPLEIILPHVETRVMLNMLISEIQKTNLSKSFIDQINEELRNKYNEFLFQKYIKNFRDVKNFTNTLIVSHDLLVESDINGKISYRDLFWIEVIRIYFPELYKLLSNDSDIILEKNKGENGERVITYEILHEENLNEPTKLKNKRLLMKPLETQLQDVEKILKILFGDNNKEEENSIKYESNYYKYFSYRLPLYVISKPEFDYFLEMDKEQAINCITVWKGKNKMSSLYDHLMDFELDKCESEKNVMNFCRAAFEVCNEDIKNKDLKSLLQKSLNPHNLIQVEKNLWCDIYNLLKQKLRETDCYITMWNRLLASIYPIYTISNGTKKVDYKSILSNAQIEKLACLNCDNYLQKQKPKIHDITNQKSSVQAFYFVKDACVICCRNDKNSVLGRKSLIYKSLLYYFSSQHKKNNKTKFLKPIKLDKGYPSLIVLLFGSKKKFNKFVKKCFPQKGNSKLKMILCQVIRRHRDCHI